MDSSLELLIYPHRWHRRAYMTRVHRTPLLLMPTLLPPALSTVITVANAILLPLPDTLLSSIAYSKLQSRTPATTRAAPTTTRSTMSCFA
jgi:hypothetical protein